MLLLARLAVLLAMTVAMFSGATALAGTGADAETVAGDAPAVEAPADAVDEEEQPWTARFLAPTTLLLGLVALGGSVMYYAVRVRGRYRVTP
jgi:hypothetical protein